MPIPETELPSRNEVSLQEGSPEAWSLTVDVEEWFHNCWHPEYLDPAARPPLFEELDAALPELLDWLEGRNLRATFFVLGEVVRKHPERILSLARRGHEVACHGDLHLRVDSRSRQDWRQGTADCKKQLEDLVGEPVLGYRAPEWSLRSWRNPRLRDLLELGFEYDSSLMAAWGAGSSENPRRPVRLTFGTAGELWEFPPWVLAGGLPANGWTGRVLPDALWRRAFGKARREGLSPVLVIHPWELLERPVPGLLVGLGKFFHEAARRGFPERLERRLFGAPPRLLREQLVALRARATRQLPGEVLESSGVLPAQNPISGKLA